MEIATTHKIAIRLADEGVPLRAIARACEIPSPHLYQTLVAARMEGRLVELPRDDWPAGCPRDQRSLQLSRLVVDHHDQLILAIQDLFGLTSIPAKLLLLLVQYEQVPHARLQLSHEALPVHICAMRKRLKLYKLGIRTLWGYGYQISPADRRVAMELILGKINPEPAVPGVA